MDIIEKATKKLADKNKAVIFIECKDERILHAARILMDKKVCNVTLLGNVDEIEKTAKKYNISLEDIFIFDVEDENKKMEVIHKYREIFPNFSERILIKKVRKNLNYAAILVKSGYADLLAAGVVYATGDVILAAQQYIGLQEGISTISSIGYQIAPRFDKEQGNQLIGLSDCAVCENPDAVQLASIAISSADSYANTIGEKARVAMLSYSTLGSSEGVLIEKIREALKVVREKRPDISIDGEFQIDTALDPKIAKRKISNNSEVAGKANVLIFPDLNAGNIAVKCMQMFGGLGAYGPLLQGFSKQVTDFSRAATIDDIVGNVTLSLLGGN